MDFLIALFGAFTILALCIAVGFLISEGIDALAEYSASCHRAKLRRLPKRLVRLNK